MKIIGIDGLTQAEVLDAVRGGAKFVMYQYCVSLVVVSHKRSSSVYFVRSPASRILKGLKFSAWSFLAGWWGIPFGPFYTVESIWRNFAGGHDLTQDLLAYAKATARASEPPAAG